MGSEAKILTSENAVDLAKWCRGRIVAEEDAISPSITTPGINLLTNEGVKRASVGDTIIRNSDGTFSVYKNI